MLQIRKKRTKCNEHVRMQIGSNCTIASTTLDCENIRFSVLFAAGTFRVEERLPLSDRNSILMMQLNVYIINPVVMGFQI